MPEGSIPNEVIGLFFNFPNPSSRTTVLVYSAYNGKEYQESSWGKRVAAS
jgi:hypothetical protein